MSPPAPTTGTVEVAIFAGGCFWGVEHLFLRHYGPKSTSQGVLETKCGYIGGKAEHANPVYKVVKSGVTDHAEAVRIVFNPEKVSYEKLVEFFFCTHDPTTKDQQGEDFGTQYRSVIFYNSDEQKATAERVKAEIQKKYFDPNGTTIVTDFADARAYPFYDAEEYHQDYFTKNNMDIKCETHKLHWEL
ncbi:Peptide-methionine (S)-S-oxide reductase [Steccherinum ochraceum]|uniref:peptide-methionine (S)-S-oxide reductase n=1 Tax=Steccherinum ochraceum TaxID=92696 RepID=A0A4R0RKQ9_9APHY|nr:Peptide-methionine (S)-S-oxide reductase [Steccherinum ochraceum]